MLRCRQGIEDRSVIVPLGNKNLCALAFNQRNGIRVHGAGDMNLSAESKGGGDAGHGPAMVAVSSGVDGEARGGEGFADRIKGSVDGQVEALGDGEKRAPRGSEDLKRRKATAACFVFEVDGADTSFAG